MAKGFKTRIREDILKRREKTLGRYGRIEDTPKPEPDVRKTLAMRLLEREFGEPIEQLIMAGSLEEVGSYLEVAPSTVSKWRLKLGLRNGN